MKKTTIAAAKKAAKKAVKKAAVKKVATKTAAKKAAKKVAVEKVPAKKAVVKKAAAKKAVKKATKKTVKKALPKTRIVANVDVGFGNTLYLRGSASGLSWSSGIPMDCAEGTSWTIDIEGVSTAFEFKVLINDEYWSAGYNEVAEPGVETVISPAF